MEQQVPVATLVEDGDPQTRTPWRGILAVAGALGLAIGVWVYFEVVRVHRPRGEWIEPQPVPEWKDDFSNVMPTLRVD